MFSMSWKAWKALAGATGTGVVTLHEMYPAPTDYTLTGLGAVAVTCAGYQACDWTVNFRHHRNWIKPLHVALRGPLGVGEDVKPRRYIKVPRDYQKREKVGRIDLPPEFTGIDTKTSAEIVKNKLGLTDVSVSFQVAGRKPHLIIRQTPRPPGKVTFAEYTELVTRAPESAPVIGLGPNCKTISVDLDAESPHVLVSASTGGGKSVITRTMCAQLLHNGGQLVVLDYKRHSHKWARELPQVIYCREISEIHDALVALAGEGHLRNVIVDEWTGPDDEVPVGPRMGILVEEANATMGELKRYWNRVRTKGDPKESPAIDALRKILFMGRAVRLHVLMVAQSATAAALGGPEVRECFATRILARYTVNAWRMLVPEIHPVPRSTRHVGRAQVVLGGVAAETQVMFFEPSEAAAWAVSGIVAEAPDLSRDMTAFPQVGETQEVSRDVTPPVLTLVKDERMSLAEACRQGVVPMSPDALRQAKRRDASFPAGESGRWTAEELRAWYRGRSA